MSIEQIKKTVSRKLSPFSNNDSAANFSEYVSQNNSVSPLRRIRKNKGFTLKKLAVASGISASYLSRIEVKARRMNEEVIRRLCAVLDCSPGDLFAGSKENATTTVVNAFANDFPLYTPVQQGNTATLDLNSNKEWLFRPAELTAEDSAFAVRITDQNNAPKFKMNDLVYVNPQKELKVGSAVVLLSKNGELVIGELVSYDKTVAAIKSYGLNSLPKGYSLSEAQFLHAIYMTVEA